MSLPLVWEFIGCVRMTLGKIFREKVRLPIWPLIPLLFVGVAITPRFHVYWSNIAGNYAVLGLLAVAIRYWWAWMHGAPWFDWLVLIALCLTMGILANLFVSAVVRMAGI